MLGIPLRYLLKHPVSAAADLAADPLQIWTTLHDSFVAEREQRRSQCPHQSDHDWEQQLHQLLRDPWPCDAASRYLAPPDEVAVTEFGAANDAGSISTKRKLFITTSQRRLSFNTAIAALPACSASCGEA
jgi:hypothetical protein